MCLFVACLLVHLHQAVCASKSGVGSAFSCSGACLALTLGSSSSPRSASVCLYCPGALGQDCLLCVCPPPPKFRAVPLERKGVAGRIGAIFSLSSSSGTTMPTLRPASSRRHSSSSSSGSMSSPLQRAVRGGQRSLSASSLYVNVPWDDRDSDQTSEG